MVMKDIEYLSLYLPYDLQLLENCEHWFDPIPDRVVTMTGLLDTDLKLPQQYDNEPIECFHISYRVDEKTTGNDYSKYFKPLLYPLSILTEEIEHEGERFVPLEKLYGFMKGHDYDLGYEGFVTVLTNIKTDHQPMILLLEMVKYHFDVFNLIQEGKAIDKSKL